MGNAIHASREETKSKAGWALRLPATYSGYATLVLDRLAKQTCEVVGAEQSCIMVLDPTQPRLAIAAAGHGIEADLLGSRVRPGERSVAKGVTAWAAISERRRLRGALVAGSTEPGRCFDADELGLLDGLAKAAGQALADTTEHRLRTAELLRCLDEIVGSLRVHDDLTGLHSAAVVGIALSVGERLGLNGAALVELELAALLHDVGKVGVPGEVLSKPGALDEQERELVERHPALGAEILRRVQGLQPVATIVHYHHERWDGGGYPEGLVGERIPLASRIVCVCDAFHAMTSDRPYRSALSRTEAIEELRGNAGTQFDARIVQALEPAIIPSG